ncbi:SAC3 family protein B isoform X3 [Ricinus communis]|uniref:SAC3 family protein B isoform X3 n=1 Tax=Ricinus communis TaxID=3988 RepID=UPI0007725277|nr:SAC3 family protein B isoform X3 [Ricinus communis]|eukprot:XP_015573320.1 SAC3 family protein B isoform X3 [Ricinus communis]
MSGFSKHSGPTGPRASQLPRFGNFTSPPLPPPQSPPFPHSAPTRSPRGPLAAERVRSQPLVYDSLIYESSDLSASSTYQSTGIPRRPETVQRVRTPSLSIERTHLGASSPYLNDDRPAVSSPQWVNGQRSFFKDDDQTNQRPSAVTSFVASRNSGISVTAKISRFQDLKRTRSPPSHAWDEDLSRNSSRTFLGMPALSQSAWDNQHKFPNNNPKLLAPQDQSSALPNTGSYISARNSQNEVADVNAPKQTGPLPISPANEVLQKNTHFLQNDSRRPSTSPPRLGPRSNARFSKYDYQIPQRTFSSDNDTVVEAAQTRTTNYSAAKRTRSPPLPAADKILNGNSYSTQDGTEREVQAKAKRLARFKKELNESFETRADIPGQKASASRRELSTVERQKFAGSHSMESTGDFTNVNLPADFDGLETSSIIIGLCPDMCPVSEREERERKGDLDQYERLDGDRNQTTKFLAVKKYNRTGEREADLIRPMPVLQKTIDYLLDLLDQPYDDRFLGIYNFLWDRMRAIRMDLRMQHIFNREAITMLEQMIRLHIIAMHELCEYTKGEGFSEGFDAHLNIEQMNKTSVDLFQMYDDHRKKGINVPTEKEFRGYYALLKLDKHPGYKVEPAELSLDLAKMTSEIRQTPEVLFARDVARACRTGNFIAFFRLARKASYLQACLMHAHFAKLRTQALASLHSGLPNSQGIPVLHVAKWLAMEEEDIESLLEYHGFSIKEFEEPYMVKEGPFANSDQDYPTKLSKLVHLKRCRKIADDVSPTSEVAPLPAQASKEIQLPKIYKLDKNTVPSTSINRKSSASESDEEMPDFSVASSPKFLPQLESIIERSKIDQQSQDHQQVEGAAYISPLVHTPLLFQPAKLNDVQKLNDVILGVSAVKKMLPGLEGMAPQVVSRTAALLEKSPSAKYSHAVESKIPHIVVFNDSRVEEPPDLNQEKENDVVMENLEDEEIAQAKLKLIIRIWKRRASKQRELREQRQIVANAALSSLSLGPPIRQAKDQLSTINEFDVEHVMRERNERYEQSWSRLNVSDVTADILGKRNPGVRCLCWKIVLLSQMNNQGDKLSQGSQVMHVSVGPWLLSKLMPSRKDDDDDLLISSSGLSIWKKWVPSQSDDDLTCCLSVVRDVSYDLDETIEGASAIVFLVSESIPWNVQKAHLQKLLMSIPSGSSLPLLVLCGSYDKEVSDPYDTILRELDLYDIDKSRVGSFLVVFLIGEQERQWLDGFFSDVRLREGLQWLASESPLQPDIHCINSRGLILTYLNASMDVLEKMNDREVGPNHCISTFNEALNWSLGEIAAAASSNPINWPCPEIALLPESCDEDKVVKRYLPSIGWSSATRIEPLLSAFRESKLPSFSEAVSWLDKGANSGDEIEDLRSQLENCLIEYLTESSGMMTFNLAIKEAYVMLQKSVRLELHESSYYIAPKWISIFRRIFNWRLTSLCKGTFSSAYILMHQHIDPPERIPDESELGKIVSSPYLTWPSLDEIIVGCTTPLIPISGRPQLEAFQPSPRTVSNGDVRWANNTNELMEDERTSAQIASGSANEIVSESANRGIRGLDASGTEVMVAARTTKETDKLSKLLEQCNLLQNSIDEKLFIYF